MRSPRKQQQPDYTAIQPIKLLTRGEVLELIGVSYPCLFGWIKRGKFPPGRSLGSGPKGHIAWIESEVMAWIASRPPRIPKGSVKGVSAWGFKKEVAA